MTLSVTSLFSSTVVSHSRMCLKLTVLAMAAIGITGCATAPSANKTSMKYYPDNKVAFKFVDNKEGVTWTYTNEPQYALAIQVKNTSYNMKDVRSIAVVPSGPSEGQATITLQSGSTLKASTKEMRWAYCEQVKGCIDTDFFGARGNRVFSRLVQPRAISERYLDKSRPVSSDGNQPHAIPTYGSSEFRTLTITTVSDAELQGVMAQFRARTDEWAAGAPQRAEKDRIESERAKLEAQKRRLENEKAQAAAAARAAERNKQLINATVGTQTMCQTNYYSMNPFSDTDSLTCNDYGLTQSISSMRSMGWNTINIRSMPHPEEAFASRGSHSTMVTFQKAR